MATPADYPPPTHESDARLDPETTARPALLDGTDELTFRWDRAQAMFVDDPRQAVQEAGELVVDVLGRLARTFEDERGRLEATWQAGGEPSTEDLRQSLRRYREFFERLLAA